MKYGTETVQIKIKRGITNDVFVQVFMNIVLEQAFEEKQGGEKVAIGDLVRSIPIDGIFRTPLTGTRYQVIRGNSVVMLEALERITDK